MTTKYININGIVYVQPDSNIDDIFNMNPGIKQFYFESGDFYITNKIVIPVSNISWYGKSKSSVDVHIYQIDDRYDGLVLNNVNKITIKYISIHVTAPGKVAITVAGCNYTTIEYCYIYGTSNTFSVYYAGPKDITAGQETLNAYYNNHLDNNNKFCDNVVYSNWSGDSVSFSLQRNASFKKNVIRGGKVAIYMCNNVNISGNTIYDSTSQGIFVSLPSNNITISNNKVYECSGSSIKIDNQTEHGTFPIADYNILISKNYFYDAHYSALELCNCQKLVITSNIFIETDKYSIYCLNSNNINITTNKISYSIVTLWVENSNNIIFDSNLIYSVYPDSINNVVKMVQNSLNNSITNNTIKGIIKYDLFAIDSSCSNNIINDNTTHKYYTRSEELDIMK